jgi:serine protease Do
MLKHKSIIWAAVLGIMLILPGFIGYTQARADDVAMVPANFSELAKIAKPGVVNIRTERTMKHPSRVFRHFFGEPYGNRPDRPGQPNPFEEFFKQFGPSPEREYKYQSLGSGFVIDKEGYIVTNNHVIDQADEIKVKLANEKEYDARVIGRDPNTDLALIKIDDAKELKPLMLGDSEKLEVGSWVVAIGSPFGFEQTVTAGIVSAKDRVLDVGSYADFIQTDASINPGNSGGPLLDLKGRVVGINTAIIPSGQGLGFAIPIDLAKTIIAQLKEKGEVTRGWLGVGIQNLTPELAEYYGLEEREGVLVTQVFEGDPADKAGMKKGDIITAINKEKITDVRELSSRIANVPVGEKTRIDIVRGGTEITLSAVIAKKTENVAVAGRERIENDDLGLQVTELTMERAQQFGLDTEEKGVLVMDVVADSRADMAGMRIGDIIKGINRNKVETLDDYEKMIEKADKDKPLLVLVSRRNAGMLAIKIMP